MRIVLDARLAAEPFAQAAKGLARLVARLKALRGAVRGNYFRTAQGLRLALPLYVRRVKGRVRNDLLRLFEGQRLLGAQRRRPAPDQAKRFANNPPDHLPAQNTR
jgi:hypothetical protein